MEPYQGVVAIDKNGDFSMYYTRITDPLISSLLSLRRRLRHPPPIPKLLKIAPALRSLYASLPFAPNLSAPEYIPTRMLTLLRTLRAFFPRHRLLLSDFSTLPDTLPGVCAPVVQTRVRGTTVPCGTLLVKHGHFDIFFPTDFARLRDMYEHVLTETPPSALAANTGSAGFFSSHQPRGRRAPVDDVPSASGLPVGERKSQVFGHAEFMETYADLEATRLRSGENPLLEYYQNVKFLF